MALLRTFAIAPLLAFVACSSSPQDPQPPVSAPPVDGGSVATTCPTPTGAGTTHTGTLTADETWTAVGSPHTLTVALSIAKERTVTIEPCAVVKITAGNGITLEGKLVAEGAADKPIRIERADATAWSTIETRAGSSLRLAYVTLDGGGSTNAAIDVRGDSEAAPQPIFFANNVTVKGSGSLGVVLREGGAFAPGSAALTISGSAKFPIQAWGNAAGSIPTGTYTGNTTDEISLTAIGGRDDIKADTTWSNRGVPYRVGGDTGTVQNVGATGAPVLTIEAGVTLRFAKLARLAITTGDDKPGALVAEGTAAAPIVFTSAEATPAAGDWVGIVYGYKTDARNKLSNTAIRFAGADSQVSSYDCPGPDGGFGNDGAIVIYGGKPASAFITNSAIEDSAGDGIVRGWTGDPLDLLATNTFKNVAGCNQSFPKPTVGVCPSPAECPK